MPHCKKFHRKKPHQAELDKCMLNKKYKGYHFKLICNKLKVVFKPRHKFSAKLGGYASKDNKSGDDWQCVGMPEDGENNNDKWIINLKPKPKVHNAFAILSQPNTSTYCNTPSPTQQMDNDKTIIPPGPREHWRQQKIAQRQHIKQTLRLLRKSDNLFLDNSITHTKGERTTIAKNDTINAKHVAIDSSHANATNQPSGLLNPANIQPTALVSSSIEPQKS
jgi:hypothetical protein